MQTATITEEAAADRKRECAILQSAIWGCECRLNEPWQSVESIEISRRNLADYRARLASLVSA